MTKIINFSDEEWQQKDGDLSMVGMKWKVEQQGEKRSGLFKQQEEGKKQQWKNMAKYIFNL